MPNQIILNMHEAYPFGTEYVPQRANHQVLVRKLLFTTNKQELLQKIKFFQKLNIPNTIQILSIFQHSKSIEIYYEYVGIRFEMWMKNMSQELQANLLKQLYAISRFLANNKISTKFGPQNVGLDKNYHIKYFIDLQNTIYNPEFDSRQLKKVFDREISDFLKSTDQKQNRISQKQKPFASQLKLNKQLQKSQIPNIDRNLDKTYSVKNFNLKLNQNRIKTQASSNQLQTELQQSKPLNKSQHVSFHDKINKIKQQLKFAKEKSAKMNRSVMDLKYSGRNKQNQTKNTLLSKNYQHIIKTKKTVSFQDNVQNEQQYQKRIKPQEQHHSEYERQNSQKILSFVLKQDKKIKSQKYKTPKNSESPIQYLDMVRSPSAYVLDFLNVLEDSSESENSQGQDQFLAKTQVGLKNDTKIQNFRPDNDKKDDLEWKNKIEKVIQNSKKLINRMRTQSKIVIN